MRSSNQLEALVDALAEIVGSPLSSPFVTETVIVPSRALGAWLSLELSKRHGVWANTAFLTPRAWLDRLTLAPYTEDPFHPSALTWTIAASLPGHLPERAFSELKAYLAVTTTTRASAGCFTFSPEGCRPRTRRGPASSSIAQARASCAPSPRCSMAERLEALLQADTLSPIDVEVARGLGRVGRESRGEVLLAAALASRQMRHGHVCVDVEHLREIEAPQGFIWPEDDLWRSALETSRLVGGAGDATPLVLDGGALYLRRYFAYETRLANDLRVRSAYLDKTLDGPLLHEGLERLFPRSEDVVLQRLAALVAVVSRLCIISGGPGTGKTTTVVKILALLAEQARRAGKTKLHVVLVAPTGKAAARLRESILMQLQSLAVTPDIRDMIPDAASTIHRALKPLPGSLTRFRHGRELPLHADVVLVDEASMVDLALMTRLVDAVPLQARLILLGDRNQLASVEAGAILGDLCGPPREPGFSTAFVQHVGSLVGETLPLDPDARDEKGIRDCVVQLRRNWRYPPGSGISRLADAINDGDEAKTLALLADAPADVARHAAISDGTLGEAFGECVREGYRPYLDADGGEPCFERFNRFRVLCAHRSGPWGVEELNPLIEGALEKARLLHQGGAFYEKRPIIVTQNDYQVNLFNGDVGLILADPSADGAAAPGSLRPIARRGS